MDPVLPEVYIIFTVHQK